MLKQIGLIALGLTIASAAVAAPKAPPKPTLCYEFREIRDGRVPVALCLDTEKPVVLRRWTIVEIPRSIDDDPEGRYTRRAIVGWR